MSTDDATPTDTADGPPFVCEECGTPFLEEIAHRGHQSAHAESTRTSGDRMARRAAYARVALTQLAATHHTTPVYCTTADVAVRCNLSVRECAAVMTACVENGWVEHAAHGKTGATWRITV